MSPVRVVSPPSGDRHEICRGSHRAIVTEVGATLRHDSVQEADSIDGFGRIGNSNHLFPDARLDRRAEKRPVARAGEQPSRSENY